MRSIQPWGKEESTQALDVFVSLDPTILFSPFRGSKRGQLASTRCACKRSGSSHGRETGRLEDDITSTSLVHRLTSRILEINRCLTHEHRAVIVEVVDVRRQVTQIAGCSVCEYIILENCEVGGVRRKDNP